MAATRRARAIRIHVGGGADALRLDEVAVPDPGPGEVLIRQTAIGVNFLDVYQRRGVYSIKMPFIGGNEGVGVVEAMGSDVAGLKVGDRVGYAMVIGAYADHRLIAADRVVPIPEGIDDVTAAAALLKGMTAEYLLHRTIKIAPGQTILVHAAAGGVGQILCQWANALGATVIGTVGSSEKAEIAAAKGCHHVINYRSEPFVERARAITGARGVDVVYDSVGADTFIGSLDAVRRRGMVITFGQSSGNVPEISPLILSRKGSLYLTRPTIADYIADRGELLESAARLFAAIASGTIRIRVDRTLPLADAADAHRVLEGRQTKGSLVLIP